MRGYTINKNEEYKDRIKSAVLSVGIWSAVLLFVFIYKMEPSKTAKEPEVITTMLVNFGDSRNGNGLEEPANQDGSLAAPAKNPVEENEAVTPEPNTALVPAVKSNTGKTENREKLISGANNNIKAAPKEDLKQIKKNTASSSNSAKSKSATSNANTGKGDGRGNAAIGNLLKGRGKNPGNQGNGTGAGNAGDPLGGDGYGDSKVGIDRELTQYIPGTMGRGGAQPSHSCTAGGSVTISYTVNKSGNVVSARRSGGISDPCVVATAVSWVKQYVKAEQASVSSTGSYKITF